MMPDSVYLADGTIFITNGGKKGRAGWCKGPFTYKLRDKVRALRRAVPCSAVQCCGALPCRAVQCCGALPCRAVQRCGALPCRAVQAQGTFIHHTHDAR